MCFVAVFACCACVYCLGRTLLLFFICLFLLLFIAVRTPASLLYHSGVSLVCAASSEHFSETQRYLATSATLRAWG